MRKKLVIIGLVVVVALIVIITLSGRGKITVKQDSARQAADSLVNTIVTGDATRSYNLLAPSEKGDKTAWTTFVQTQHKLSNGKLPKYLGNQTSSAYTVELYSYTGTDKQTHNFTVTVIQDAVSKQWEVSNINTLGD